MKKVNVNDYIVADPQIAHGKPTFKGTRVMVWQVIDMLKDKESEKEIMGAFPSLTPSHIKAALEFASKLMKQGYASPNTHLSA